MANCKLSTKQLHLLSLSTAIQALLPIKLATINKLKFLPVEETHPRKRERVWSKRC